MEVRQEQEVAQGLRDGKTEAWHALYDAFAEPVWRCVAAGWAPMRPTWPTWSRRSSWRRHGGPGASTRKRGSLWLWLSGIARNHVALHFRTQKRHGQLRTAEPGAAAGRQRIVQWLEDRQCTAGRRPGRRRVGQHGPRDPQRVADRLRGPLDGQVLRRAERRANSRARRTAPRRPCDQNSPGAPGVPTGVHENNTR